MNKIQYEPNIDFLRGISIILVTIYHLKIEIFNIKLLPGGYLGVDIFFVISGYLITSILYINLKRNKFTLKQFFIRRFTRIFPVYIFVIVITSVLAFFLLVPNQLYDLAKSSIYSLIFVSNIFFWRSLNNYYNPDAIFDPLLHTWSLGIEIQFYLFFSILFIFLFKFTNKLKFSLFLIGIISLILSISLSYIEPQINFFGFQSRLWEFLLGSFVFFYKDNFKINLSKFLKYSIYFLIIIFAILFNENTKHPSFLTLFLLILVSIIIIDKSNYKLNFFDKILLFFGLISYSLYLWHYPILSLSERIFFNQTYEIKIFLILVSILLSYLSFNLLERKLKKNLKSTILFSFSLLSISLLIIYLFLSSSGYPNRLAQSNFFKINTKDLNYSHNYNNVEFNKKILILGNSHSVQTYQGFTLNHEIYKNYDFQNFHIQISCIEEEIFLRNYDKCKGKLDLKSKADFINGLNKISESSLIILSTRWSQEDLENLQNVIKILKKRNKKLIIFGSLFDISKKNNIINTKNFDLNFLQKNYINKLFPYEKYLYLNNKFPNSKELDNLNTIYFQNISPQTLERNSSLEKIAYLNEIPLLNLNSYICNMQQKQCEVITDDKKHILYDTTGHLTMYGAKYLFKKINPSFEEIILKLNK